MIIHDEFEQGSCAWLEAKAGVVSASEIDALVSPLWKVREGLGVKTYIARKLAEKWGGPLPQKKLFATDQGNILEEEARPGYAFEHGVKVEVPGFITTDDGRAGCSPDGVVNVGVGATYGLEIKSPESPTHVGYLLNGHLPPEYRSQVQFSLYVTGFPSWRFLSYRRQFPQFLLVIKPDSEAFAAFDVALADFYERFDSGWKHLVALNGGKEPAKREPMVFADEIQRGITQDYGQGIIP